MDETESAEPLTPPAPEAAAPTPAPAQPETVTAEAVSPAAEIPQTPEAEAAAPISEAPESPIAPAGEPAAAAAPEVAHDPEALASLAEKASAQRLPQAEEERASQLLRAALLSGQEDLIALLPKLGWAASSRGVAAAWGEMKATSRNAFIKALIADETEAGRRVRLSIARGLFKVPDVAACTKLVLATCKELRDKKTGEISQRDAQNFAAVMIGKGKPWIGQIPLAELKPADSALLVHCAIVAAFSVGGPPVTPLGVLKWAAEAGQLAELHESVIAAAVKGVSRWSPKWAEALRKEVPTAPEAILAALKTAQPEPEPAAASADGLPAELRAESAAAPAEGDAADDDDDDDDDEDGLPDELKGEGDGEAKERPVYVSKTIPPKEQREQRQPQQPQQQRERGPAPKSAQFNASDVLRQVESHISWLKNELQFAEKKLRNREDDQRREAKRKVDVPVIEGQPTPEELARLNVQLEARITELQSRIDDLTADAEERATSAGVFTGEHPAPDVQLRTLLGLKLADSYADFAALEQEDRDIVIPQHYRTVLAEVFEVLKAEGIPLQPEPPAAS